MKTILVALIIFLAPSFAYACDPDAFEQEVMDSVTQITDSTDMENPGLRDYNEFYFIFTIERNKFSEPRTCSEEEKLRVAYNNYLSSQQDLFIYIIYTTVFPDDYMDMTEYIRATSDDRLEILTSLLKG